MITTFVQNALKQTIKTTYYVVDSFKPESYCFFDNQYVPVRVNDYDLQSVTSPSVAYYYTKESGFYKNGEEFSNSRLNIITATLHHHNLQVADLSQFFYETTYEAAEGIPQLGCWVAAWQLKHKLFLDVTKEFTLRFTTILGQQYTIQYLPHNNDCQQAWARVNQDIRHFVEEEDSNTESEDEGQDEMEEDSLTNSPVQQAAEVATPQEPLRNSMVDAATQTDSPARQDASTQTESTDLASTELSSQ